MRFAVALSFALLLALLSGCPGPVEVPDAPEITGHAVGEPCATGSDCASGACLPLENVCTAPCTASSECGSLVCGRAACEAPEGCALCVPACGTGDYTCVEGVSTSCALVRDERRCLDCGCPDSLDHCVRDVGCFPPADVGEPCVLDSDCSSRSCSSFGDVCRVPVGQACTAENCDTCLTLPTGSSYCSRECRTATDCRGMSCVGIATLGFYECLPAACSGDACPRAGGNRETGQPCRADDECRSGTCFQAQRCSGADCVGDGWCSEPCAASSDCAAAPRAWRSPVPRDRRRTAATSVCTAAWSSWTAGSTAAPAARYRPRSRASRACATYGVPPDEAAWKIASASRDPVTQAPADREPPLSSQGVPGLVLARGPRRPGVD